MVACTGSISNLGTFFGVLKQKVFRIFGRGGCLLFSLRLYLRSHGHSLAESSETFIGFRWGYPNRSLDGLFHGTSTYKWMMTGATPISGNLQIAGKSPPWFEQLGMFSSHLPWLAAVGRVSTLSGNCITTASPHIHLAES